VLNDCAEVAADWESAVTDKGRLGAYVDGQIARRERLGLPPLSDERGA
jgi:hypothetical protein